MLGSDVASDGAALVFLQRVVVEGVVVVPVVLVVELVVVVLGICAEFDVGERAGALAEQPVVEALLQFPRFAEPASSSFSRHDVTCLARQRTGTVCCRNRSPRRLQFWKLQLTGRADSRNGPRGPRRRPVCGWSDRNDPWASPWV